MRSSTPIWLVVIAAVTILAVWISLPGNQSFNVQPGLDIQGGLRVLLAADAGVTVNADQLDQARQIISRRVNGLGVAEPVVQVSGNNRIVVEIPGVKDPDQATNLIKQTGLLEFVDFSKTGACTATFPGAQQYVVTDRQLALASGGTSPTLTGTPGSGTPTTSATIAATAAAPAAFNTVTAPTVAPTTVPTAVLTVAATVAATQAVFVPIEGQPFAKQVQLQATGQATAQPTAAATDATPAASAAATLAATSAATAAAGTPSATPGATTVPRDGTSKERALFKPVRHR